MSENKDTYIVISIPAHTSSYDDAALVLRHNSSYRVMKSTTHNHQKLAPPYIISMVREIRRMCQCSQFYYETENYMDAYDMYSSISRVIKLAKCDPFEFLHSIIFDQWPEGIDHRVAEHYCWSSTFKCKVDSSNGELYFELVSMDHPGLVHRKQITLMMYNSNVTLCGTYAFSKEIFNTTDWMTDLAPVLQHVNKILFSSPVTNALLP